MVSSAKSPRSCKFAWKNEAQKPFGPGALIPLIENSTCFISRSNGSKQMRIGLWSDPSYHKYSQWVEGKISFQAGLAITRSSMYITTCEFRFPFREIITGMLHIK